MVASNDQSASAAFPLLASLQPMEARSASALPEGVGWQFEPKWDGFRCLAVRYGSAVELRGKSGKLLGRFFPEVCEMLAGLAASTFALDGELIPMNREGASLDELQLRLHPAASRIKRLSSESPAALVVFDMLATPDGCWLVDAPLSERRLHLDSFLMGLGEQPSLRLSPTTTDRNEAEGWLAKSGAEWDGVMAKRLDAPYLGGEREMLKIKRIRTADCVVGGFRYATNERRVGSLLLGLYDESGRLNHVGFTSGFAKEYHSALTKRLESIVEPPGFTGKSPGGPSRWSNERSQDWLPLHPQLVAEVQFDHTTADRFRHGTKLVRWRPDKSPRDCTMEQLRS